MKYVGTLQEREDQVEDVESYPLSAQALTLL